jgi:hypothetical protein
LLIQKSGNYIENFGIVDNPIITPLLELVIKYCNKIKLLHLDLYLNNQVTNLVPSLIEDNERNLNYLYIEVNSIRFNSILLQNLGQILPYKLEYLTLFLYIKNTRDLEVFLKNTQNTLLKNC